MENRVRLCKRVHDTQIQYRKIEYMLFGIFNIIQYQAIPCYLSTLAYDFLYKRTKTIHFLIILLTTIWGIFMIFIASWLYYLMKKFHHFEFLKQRKHMFTFKIFVILTFAL